MASTGNVFVATGESVARGSGLDWTSPGNIVSDNATDATCAAPDTNGSDYLVARNADLSSIPDDAIIKGVLVRVEASEHSGGTEPLLAQLQDESGALVGSSKSTSNEGSISGTAKAVYTYGSASDLWGATLTPAIVKDPDFGVRLWFATAHDVRIDFVTIAVTYQHSASETEAIALNDTPTYPDTARSAADGLALDEDITTVTTYAFGGDAIALNEFPGIDHQVADTEGLELDESPLGALGVSVTDALALDESPDEDYHPGQIDALALSDFPGIDHQVTDTEGLELDDLADEDYNPGAIDALALDESPAVNVGDAAEDGLELNDIPTYPETGRSAEDGLALDEDITTVTTYAFGGDGIALGDAPGHDIQVSASDDLALGEDLDTVWTVTGTPDGVALDDSANYLEEVAVDDGFALNDALAIAIALGIVDGVQFNDLLASVLGTNSADGIGLGEAPSGTLNALRSAADGVALGDLPDFTIPLYPLPGLTGPALHEPIIGHATSERLIGPALH